MMHGPTNIKLAKIWFTPLPNNEITRHDAFHYLHLIKAEIFNAINKYFKLKYTVTIWQYSLT